MVAPQPSRPSDAEVLDAIVIGGGPAGSLHGALTVERKAVETIKRLGIRIIETPIALLEGAGDKLEGIQFTDSSFLPRSAVFFSPGQYQRSPLAEQLGCEFCEEMSWEIGKGAEST